MTTQGKVGETGIGSVQKCTQVEKNSSRSGEGNPFLEAALQYAGRGWKVLPVHSMRNGRCSCNAKPGTKKCKPAKHPRTKHGVSDASNDPEVIAEWWRRWPDANIGIATGEPSGLIVFDLDGPEGERTFRQLLGMYGKLSQTAVVATARGAHIYFSGKIFCDSSAGEGLEIRSTGYYVIAPPSVHASGHVYKWLKP